MLARSGSLPTRGRWAYEVKWDGFRALVRAGDHYRVRSCRGWDMTQLAPELKALQARRLPWLIRAQRWIAVRLDRTCDVIIGVKLVGEAITGLSA
jgi:hypothetical protein